MSMVPMATSKSTVGVLPPASGFCAFERLCDGHHSYRGNGGVRMENWKRGAVFGRERLQKIMGREGEGSQKMRRRGGREGHKR